MISLLYKNEKEVASVLEPTLFTDLKIGKLLEYIFDNYSEADEVIDILKEVPFKDSLIYRQEVFNDVLNDKDNLLEGLYYELVDVVGRFQSLRGATENIKRKIFFIFYEYYYYVLLEDTKKTLLDINATSSCFKNIIKLIDETLASKETIKKREQITRIYNNIVSHLSFNLEYHDGAPYYQVTFEDKNNLEDKLTNIAKGLNVNFVKQPKSVAKHEINPYFLREISINDSKIYNELTNFYELNKNDSCDLTDLVKEAKYYLSIKTVFNRINKYGIPICKVEINDKNENEIIDAYDVSLMISNIQIVPNDYYANDNEFIQFVLGVNSGGKTCYLRSIAINYVFNSTVGFMFAKSAKIFPVRYIHTHFPNEENYALGEGRLRDEIKRLKVIKDTFSNECIAFLNETFSSTSEEKACVLTHELLDDIGDTKAKVMYVTHQYKIFEELHDARIGFYTPVVIEGENNIRTHKIKKVEKKLLSYVGDILNKYGLTKKQLLEKKASLGEKHE